MNLEKIYEENNSVLENKNEKIGCSGNLSGAAARTGNTIKNK